LLIIIIIIIIIIQTLQLLNLLYLSFIIITHYFFPICISHLFLWLSRYIVF